jgi:signal transduction histidine kinase
VTGDPLRLGQVACNLFANAAEAMAGQPERPAVLRVATRLDNSGAVLVTVEDNGPGLTDAVRRRLFEPFFTTKEQGLGMGLLFCRSVIERHGGRLWADDNPAGGAIFCFTLPADDTAESVAIQ